MKCNDIAFPHGTVLANRSSQVNSHIVGALCQKVAGNPRCYFVATPGSNLKIAMCVPVNSREYLNSILIVNAYLWDKNLTVPENIKFHTQTDRLTYIETRPRVASGLDD